MIKWCVEHKIIVVLFSIMLLIGGFYAYSVLERQENPTITPPIAMIQCVYPGASPEDVEKQIIKPIEKEIGTMENVKTIDSYALDSVAIIKVTLKDMSDASILRNWETLKDRVDDAQLELPETAMEPTVDTELANSFGLVIGLSAKDYTNQDLRKVAKQLEKELSKVEGVAEVKMSGDVQQVVNINVDMIKLKQYGISPNTIGMAIKSRNISIPGGNLEMKTSKIPVQITGEYTSIQQLEETIVGVSPETGLPVQLKDLAQLILSDEKPERYAQVGSDKAVLIGVRYATGQNVLEAGKRVSAILESFKNESLYARMHLTVLTNQPDFVEEAIDLFVDNLVSAIILVVAVVWLFMGLRSAIVVSVPIALVIAMVLVYMQVTQIPLHQISIAALIISLSLLVANGIVANDNVYLYLQQGKNRTEAVIQGIKDVSIPILTSTLTTIASFLPLAMMQGSAGKFAVALPILVSVSLIASLITALTVVPAMAHQILEVKSRSGGWVDHVVHWLRINHLNAWFMKWYDAWLSKALIKPRTTILVFVMILVLTGSIVPFLNIQVFPPVQRDQYVISVTLPSSTTLEESSKVAKQIAVMLNKEKSVTSFGNQVGDGFIQYYDSFMAARRGSNVVEFLINGKREEAEAIVSKMIKQIPNAAIDIKFLELNMPQDQPVQIRISGSDISVLKKTAEDVQKSITHVPGVWRTEVSYGQDSYKLKVKVNESKANMSGITNYDIAATVRMAVNGTEVSQLKQKDIEAESLPIVMRIGEGDLKDVDSLQSIFLTSQITGENVPLGQVAELKVESNINQIIRRDEERTITVGVHINKNTSSQQVLADCQKALSQFEVPKSYTLSYGGDHEFADDTFGSMVIPAILAIVLIYVIMALQFGSLLEPLIIMGTIPLSFIGIILGLMAMGYPIGFMAMLGAISLMGVVVNNGIVLLDYIKLLQQSGMNTIEAVKEGSVTRMRPIMIGMATTVISLMPLMISGGPLWQPLATALNFGMVTSTVLTLIVVPASYVLVESIREKHWKAS